MGRYKTGLARETNPASPGITRFIKVGNGPKVGIVFSTIYPQAAMTWGAATAEVPGSRRERRLLLVVAGWRSYDSIA
jgi:hypothetical protein